MKQLEEIEILKPEIRLKYFNVFFYLLLANLFSVSVICLYFPVLRFIRQPLLLVVILLVIHLFPAQQKQNGFHVSARFFFFLCIYLVFNSITSLDPGNTIAYAVWLMVFFIFFYQFLIVRNELRFDQILFQFVAASCTIGILLISISYIAGYGFNNLIFWDKRFNYTYMKITLEFAGILGSNNSFGMLTFVTSVYFLFLFEFTKGTSRSFAFLGVSVFLSLLLISIGNRASMACSLLFWVFCIVWVYRSILATIFLAACLLFGFITFKDIIIPKLRIEQFEGGNVLGNRASLFNEALLVAEEMDFFGVGYHNQRLSRVHFGLARDDEKEYNFHNTYLAMLTEFGYLGFIWIPGVILFLLLKTSNERGDDTRRRRIRMLKSFILVLILLYLPVEDSINSPGSPIFIFFWSTFFILGIGLYETKGTTIKTLNEEKNRISDHSIQGS
jgi:hypothetical protein